MRVNIHASFIEYWYKVNIIHSNCVICGANIYKNYKNINIQKYNKKCYSLFHDSTCSGFDKNLIQDNSLLETCLEELESFSPICTSCIRNLKVRRPPFCESCGIRIVSEHTICSKCKLELENKDTKLTFESPPFSLWTYNSYSSHLIQAYKSKSKRYLGYYLAQLYKLLIVSKIHTKQNITLIPIPANPKHIKEIGFDHMNLVCKYLRLIAPQFNIIHLARKASLEQKKLDRKHRFENMKQSLYFKHSYFNSKKIIISILKNSELIVIIDDIITTGSTIFAAINVISEIDKQLKSKIRVISLIKTEY